MESFGIWCGHGRLKDAVKNHLLGLVGSVCVLVSVRNKGIKDVNLSQTHLK